MQPQLLFNKKFHPLFWVQFQGALSDNLLKGILSVMVAMGIWDSGFSETLLVSFISALFILPFLIFTPLGGILADLYPRHRYVQVLKALEFFIIVLACLALYYELYWIALLTMIGLAIQSALFSATKFSYVPLIVKKSRLVEANALYNIGTYLAILLGMVLGSYLGGDINNTWITISGLSLLSLAGLVMSIQLPHTPRSNSEDNKFIPTIVSTPKEITFYIPAITLFYFTGSGLLAQIPNYVDDVLNDDHIALSTYIMLLCTGLALGGFSVQRFKNILPEKIYIATLQCMTTVLLTGLSMIPIGTENTISFVVLLASLGIVLGLYIVPLFASIQSLLPERNGGKIMGFVSFSNAIMILLSSILGIALFALGLNVQDYILALALVNILFMLYYLFYAKKEAT